MKNAEHPQAKDDKQNSAAQPDRTDKPAPKGEWTGGAGELSEEDLQSIAGGPTAVERRP